MRFLCEQCKAKYQIADEKVAGKTVRMKCRKCGHLIEVKAEVTETSVASKALIVIGAKRGSRTFSNHSRPRVRTSQARRTVPAVSGTTMKTTTE